jgi:D-arabinitol 4-dehydrogenase
MPTNSPSLPSPTRPLQILHLGLGSFHRAHQAVYIQRLIDDGDTAWRLVGGNLRPDMADTLAALAAQNGGYTLETVSPSGQRNYQVIHAISRVVPFDPQLRGLVEVGADPDTRIISFTVTEAGYYLDAAHRLDAAHHADVRSDLDGQTRCTIYGALAAILGARMRAGSGAVTLLNCDNLRCNGERVHAGLQDFLRQRGDGELLAWLEHNASFPNAMVDRITPRPTPEVSLRVKAATGFSDRVPVMAESFLQWVIEDDFRNGRPDWEGVGVEMVRSVLPYEEAKIRILNSSHSCIAWAGTLLGLQYIHEAVALPEIRQMAFDYVTEAVIPCLDRPDARCPIDLPAYRDLVLDRFGNPHLHDSNERVAMDGYSKVSGFLWPTFQELLALQAPIDKVAKLTALFFEFLRRWHQGLLPYAYQDQGMDPAKAHAFFEAPDPLRAFAGDPTLWGPLAGNADVLAALRRQLLEVQAFVAGHVASRPAA